MPSNTVQDRTLLAGLTKNRQGRLQWLNATVPVGDSGQFTEINLVGFTVTFSGSRLTITGSSGAQAGIQFKDEGVNLGTSGTVDTLNFVGANVAATRVGNVVTVTVTSSGGTVTSVSSGNIGTTFATVTVTNPTTTPAFAFALTNAPAHKFWGNNTGSAGAPDYFSITTADLPVNPTKRGPGCVFTNGGLLLSGTLISEIEVPYGFSGTGWTIVTDATGSGSIVVSHSTFSAYDTMTTILTATLTTAKKNQATGLTFSLAAGDILRFSGSGFSGATRMSIVLDGTVT